MSNVTNVILAFSAGEQEEDRLAEVNEFPFHCGHGFHDDAADSYGGCKAIERPTYVGAFNHLDVTAPVDHLERKVRWEYPQYVQLFVCKQHDDMYAEMRLS